MGLDKGLTPSHEAIGDPRKISAGSRQEFNFPANAHRMGKGGNGASWTQEGGSKVSGDDGLRKYSGGESEVTAPAGKTSFTGGAAKDAITGREFPNEQSAKAYGQDMMNEVGVRGSHGRAGHLVRTQQGAGSSTMEKASPGDLAAYRKAAPSLSKRDKSGNPAMGTYKAEVQTDYGGGDVANYYNGEQNPVETSAINSLTPSDQQKLNPIPGTLAPNKEDY